MPDLEVKGFRSSAEHDKHIEILEFCRQKGVSLPRETAAYFGDGSEDIDPRNIEPETIEDLLKVDIGAAVSDYDEREMVEGYVLDVRRLPPDVTTVRFEVRY